MCIRDRLLSGLQDIEATYVNGDLEHRVAHNLNISFAYVEGCLLYTSDAADERSSVDLGGRRIIKKKKRTKRRWTPVALT